MTTFTRQTHPTSWIGYASAPTKPVAIRLTADGDIAQRPVRPEVYVREFTSILVKEIKVSDREGRGGVRSVSVTFDAESSETGSDKRLKHNFSGSTVENSEVHKALQWAHDSGQPVYVAIETRRRYKNKSGEVIPYTVPMYVLRGAEPDGSRANSNITGENCANVIAVVGPANDGTRNVISSEAATDPEEWDQFRHNRDGSTPPEGWARIFTEAGETGGAIVRSENASPAAGSGAGAGATVDAREVAEQVVKILHGDPGERPVQRLRSVESKPWEMVNVDGRLNPASYVVQSVRFTRKDAIDLVQSAAYADPEKAAQLGDERLSLAATELIKPLMWAASRVQQVALGYQRQTEPSWRESAKWVSQVALAELPFMLEYVEDRHEGSEWIKRVAATAGDLYALALETASEIVGVPVSGGPDGGGQNTPEQAPAPQQQQQAPAPQQQQEEAAPQQESQAPAPAPTEETNVQSTPQGQTLADRQDLQELWDELIEKLGMVNHIEQLHPILQRNFGTHLSSGIPADRFDRMVRAGLTDTPAFKKAAHEAFLQVSQQIPA